MHQNYYYYYLLVLLFLRAGSLPHTTTNNSTSADLEYRGSRAIRAANLRLRLGLFTKYIQTMVKFCLNYY